MQTAHQMKPPFLKDLQDQIFNFNGTFIPASFSLLGPQMADGGAAKKSRDDLFYKVAVQMGFVDSLASFENLNEEDRAVLMQRKRLSAVNLQTADQVRSFSYILMVLFQHFVWHFNCIFFAGRAQIFSRIS